VKVDHDKLKSTITTAMRMLDNVIDINYYAVQSSRPNMRHRPVGLGIMGFQDCRLYERECHTHRRRR
jgi:ribonucleoside-diphosphate reductase alpha chain